jgi:hypothetical protein
MLLVSLGIYKFIILAHGKGSQYSDIAKI